MKHIFKKGNSKEVTLILIIIQIMLYKSFVDGFYNAKSNFDVAKCEGGKQEKRCSAFKM